MKGALIKIIDRSKIVTKLTLTTSLEKLLPASGGSVFRLIRLATVRALEIADGKPRLINGIPSEKSPIAALEEIAQGFVVCKINGKVHSNGRTA